MPRNTKIHSKTKPKRITSTAAMSTAVQLLCTRKPTSRPMPTVTASPQTWIAVSASERPTSTALRGIGSERSRAIRPPLMSSAMPTDAYMQLNTAPVAMNPGTTKFT